jgi:serine/threonine protein kinase
MNYTLKSILGEGGMAIVHLAEDHKFHTEVALKMLKKEFVTNENIKKRFLAEARSMFRMSHPNVIKVTDLIDEEHTVAFVMEYVAGETLKEYLERKGALPENEVREIFSQMLDAVGYVHEQQLVHRDIKPSNFMLDKKGKVKLMDFGIAKNTDVDAAEYTQTGTGMQMGTPMYMSPEQITETKSVTAQSDIYSLGVVQWQLVTGQKPYDMKILSSFQLQTKIVTERLAKTNTVWDKVIQKATAKDCVNRYKSCTELKQALAGLLTGKVIESESTQIEKKRIKAVKKKPIEDSQLISKPLLDKPITEGLASKKKNSNSAIYISIFVGSIILTLIFYVFKQNSVPTLEYSLVQDSTLAADSLGTVAVDMPKELKANDNFPEKSYKIDQMANRPESKEYSEPDIKKEGPNKNNKEVDDSYFNTFDKSKSNKTGIAIKGAKLKRKPDPHGYVIQEFNSEREVQILDYSNQYYKACYGSNCGFISEVWIKDVKNKSENSGWKKVGIAIKGAKLKRTPDPLGNIIKEFNTEIEIQILDYSNQYYKVCYGSYCGYMSEVWIKNIK